MGKDSAIQWTDATWNPFHGCIKVSDGCKYCYMFREKEKYGQNGSNILRSKTTFNNPLKWKEPLKVFTCSWSDFFIAEADAWRPEAWEIIKKCPHLTFQILTKRPERIKDHLPPDWGEGYDNVWLGVSVESDRYTWRITSLENVPAKTKFISFEPLLGPLVGGYIGQVDWIIIGGESGNDVGYWRYRPCEYEWMEAIVAGYQSSNERGNTNTAIFVKQMGSHIARMQDMSDTHGGNFDEFPESLKIREFPKNYQP